MKLTTTTVRKKDNVVAITLLMAACKNKLTGNCCKIGLLNKFMDILKKLIINPWHLMKPFTNISTETKKEGGFLYEHLRRKRKYRHNRTHTYKRRGQIPNRRSISERPDIVNQRVRVGDFEGDLIIGKAHKGAVINLVDRKSLYTLLRFTTTKEAPKVSEKILRALQPLNNGRFHTLTLDNGLEFADHKNISDKLGKMVYFADPYSPWQRGCNENTNGLVRQYLPKGMDFSNLTPQKIYFIQEKLNHRPRKKLGYRTPFEVFYGFFALNP